MITVVEGSMACMYASAGTFGPPSLFILSLSLYHLSSFECLERLNNNVSENSTPTPIFLCSVPLSTPLQGLIPAIPYNRLFLIEWHTVSWNINVHTCLCEQGAHSIFEKRLPIISHEYGKESRRVFSVTKCQLKGSGLGSKNSRNMLSTQKALGAQRDCNETFYALCHYRSLFHHMP